MKKIRNILIVSCTAFTIITGGLKALFPSVAEYGWVFVWLPAVAFMVYPFLLIVNEGVLEWVAEDRRRAKKPVSKPQKGNTLKA